VTQRAAHRRFWPAELVALCVALASSVGFIVLAGAMPFYSSSVSGQASSGPVVGQESTSTSLVEVNGPHVLVIIAIPLMITIAVFGILLIRGVERGPGAVAWTMIGLLSVITIAGMLTIGPLILPTTAGLGTACGIRQVRRRRD
jgi:hypothetical protein